MNLVDLTYSTYRIPFRTPFLTAHGTLHKRRGVLVRVRTSTGHVGSGEIAPLPQQCGAGLREVLAILPDLAREWPGREVTALLDWLLEESQSARLPAALLCGLETALLDVCGQASAQSVAELLLSDTSRSTRPRTCVAVNAVIGDGTIETVVKQARAAVAAGFSCLKLKAPDSSPDQVERVAALREAVGPAIALRLDANEGWNFEQARRLLAQCALYDIQYVEQPLPARDWAGMARLRRLSPIPLAADEAVCGPASARRVLEAEAADVLIVKPQMVGGLRTCRQVIQEAGQRQVACVITSTLEAGIGVAAALHLAAATPEITLACGLATLDLLEDNLLCADLPINAGLMHVPEGPGLGVKCGFS